MNAAKLKSFLECPVCFLLPRNRIIDCTNGHKTCESCYNKLKGGEGSKVCPQGGCPYDKPPRRARDFEALIENSTFNIPCGKPGCHVEMKKDQLDIHERSCAFRKVPCPDLTCRVEVQYNSLNLHIRDSHLDSVVITKAVRTPLLNDNIINDNDQKWALCIYREAGFEFYPTFLKQDGLWYFWIKMNADPVTAASWSYHASCENVEHRMLVEYTGGVHPVDLGFEEVIATGQYMVFNKQNVIKLKVKANEHNINTGNPNIIKILFKLFKK